MHRRILGIAAILTLSGCASLHIRSDDSAGLAVAKGFARVPVGIFTLGISEAWHARERMMESWLGKNETDLLMAWGPPSAVYSDGAGGKILTYAEQRTYVSPGYATTHTTGSATGYTSGNITNIYGQAQSTTSYIPSQIQQWQVFRQFHVDVSGRITAYAWRGL